MLEGGLETRAPKTSSRICQGMAYSVACFVACAAGGRPIRLQLAGFAPSACYGHGGWRDWGEFSCSERTLPIRSQQPPSWLQLDRGSLLALIGALAAGVVVSQAAACACRVQLFDCNYSARACCDIGSDSEPEHEGFAPKASSTASGRGLQRALPSLRR